MEATPSGPPTTSSVEPPPMSTTSVPADGAASGDTAKHQLRLLLAREQPRREAVAPLDLAEESLAVLRVANGARRDGERPLGSEPLDLAPVLGQAVTDTGDRQREEAAPARRRPRRGA